MSASELRQPLALLLDIDNTVYPYLPCHRAGMQSAYECSAVFGLWRDQKTFLDRYANARDTVKGRLGVNASAHCRLLYFKEMVEGCAGFTDFEQIQHLESAYWGGFESKLIPDLGCLDFLQEAAKLGIKLAWISNFTTQR